VVVFHLHLALGSRPLLPGGYLGVDVFFCLSGFLITRLLLDEHRTADRISLGRFWYRRARRLLPAMFAVVATVLVVVAVDRTTAAVVGSQRGPALSTLLYVANWREELAGADYFAQFADAPLGHTWSLAIEEQFYLVWPIVVAWLLRRRSPRT